MTDEEHDEIYQRGIADGRIPGDTYPTEIGDVVCCIREFADQLMDSHDMSVRLVSYKEVNDIKRRLLESIDECIEK